MAMVVMSDQERLLFLRVMDGYRPILTTLHFIANHKECNRILEWLIKNKITGKNFQSWLFDHFDGSQLALTEYVVMRLEKLKKPRRLIIGIDFK